MNLPALQLHTLKGRCISSSAWGRELSLSPAHTSTGGGRGLVATGGAVSSAWERRETVRGRVAAGRRAQHGYGGAGIAVSAEHGGSAGLCQSDQAQRIREMPRTLAQRGGNVGGPGQAQQRNGQIAQRRHGVGGGAGTDLRAVLIERHIAHPMQLVLDGPVAAVEFEEPCGRGLLRGQTGDAAHDLVAQRAAGAGRDEPLDLKDLPAVREIDVAVDRGTRADPSLLEAPVALIERDVLRGGKPRGRGVGCPGVGWADCL